jgi:hypothetical protein
MSAMDLKTKRSLGQLTAEDLKSIVRMAVHEALRDEMAAVQMDSRGYLLFANESEYVTYLKTQTDKLPSQVKACFVDPQGFRVRYSDFEPTSLKKRKLAKRKSEPTVSGEKVWEEWP